MATGAEIIEPAAPSMEHASGILDQIVTEFSLGELKPHVEMHQPLQAMESTEELVITNGCKAEESVRDEYEGNGRALEGASFSESPPSAKVAAGQNEAGEGRCEEADETSMHKKQPLGDVTVGEEHGHKTDEAELEGIKEEKTSRETSREECVPIIEKEVSTLEKSADENESGKFDVEYTERNLGEIKDAKPGEAGIECKSEDTDTVASGFSLVKESEVGLLPEEASDSISGRRAVIESVAVGKDEEGLTGQSKSGTEKPEDCVPVAAGATIITEDETPSLSHGFRQEEAREDKDELDLPLVQEEETITSKPVEMEIEELHEVSSCKPEEQVTEKDECPLLTETPTEDAHEASKSAEIPVSIHPPTEEKLPAVEEAGQLHCEAGDMEIPKEQVDEASSTTETMAEDETKAIKDAEDAIDKDHSLEQDMPLTEGEKRLDDVIEEDASVLKAGGIADDTIVECPPEEKNPLLVDEAEPLDNGVNDTEAEKLYEIPSVRCKEETAKENEAPMSREAQAEDISEASESREIAIPEQPSPDKEDLPLDQEDVETEELKTESVDMEVEKVDDISNFESKEKGNGELEAPLAREIQAEEESETQVYPGVVIADHSLVEKECEQTTEETNASEASATPVTGTEATDCLKEAEEEQTGVEIGHDTEAPSASLEDCRSAEEVAPAADEKEAEITEPKEDTGDVVASKDEATEASAALAEEHEVAPSAENAEPSSSKDTSDEANDEPLKCDPETSVTVPLVGEGDIKEVKSGDEEPNINDSTSKEAAPIEDEVGTEVEPEIENHARSIDTPLEEIDTKEDDTSNLDKVEGDKHEEVTCDELSTEIPENSPMLPLEEINKADMEVAEAPEDNRKIDEILLQEEEKLTNENEQNEGGEDIRVTAEKQSEEKVHNPEDEILMSNETEDVTDKSKMDEPKVSDECSPNQNMQAEEIEKVEPLPVSSILEKAILEESMASSVNPVEELGEDHKPVNVEVDSKPDAHIIEEVIDSADTGKEISYAPAPSSEDHGYEAISGTEHHTLQEPNESPNVDDGDKIVDRECTPNEISETDRRETVNETTDAAEVIEEHDEPKKATEDEKEVKVQCDINLESSLDSKVGEEKCVEEEEVKTTREVVETQEANLRSHEGTIEAETQEKDSEIIREVVSGSEDPEISTEFEDADKQTSSEEVTTSLEPEKQCKNDSTEEKVTSEEVRDAEILMRDASVDVTDQGKVDEPKENQDVQTDDGGCDKPGDEALNNAEPLPASSQTEEIILEESTTSKNLDGELVEDDKSENVPVDSKPVAYIIEVVNDSADTEISCASEPALEDQSDEVLPGAKEDTFQKPDQGLSADDVNEFRDQVCIPAVLGGAEVKETIECVSETERHESVDGTTDVVELTEERDDIEKADENDKEVKVQDDVNTESVFVTEVREEKCLEEEEVQASGAPEPERSESVDVTAPVEDEADDQSNKETGKPETEVIDTETAPEVMSGTEVTELPTVSEDANKQKSFEEATGSSEPQKQCEKATGADDPVEEKASTAEVDDGEVKTRESESLEEREIDEVGDSNVIHATSPVEYAAIKEADTGPVPEGTEVETVNPEEIIAGGSTCETTSEDLEKEKVQEGGSGSILETEDAAEEASSNPTSQQCITEQEIATKDAAVQDPDNENEGSKAALEEACGSKHPEAELVDAVDGTFEEERSEQTGIPEETGGISREMDVSDSRCTESVPMEETNSDQSRELETQILAPVSDAIPEIGENETADKVEETTEENEKVVKLQENEADKELPCAAEVTKFEEQQQTVDGDSDASEGTKGISSEADTERATKVEDLVQEPLKEDTKTTDIEASISEEATATADVTDHSFEKAETTPEPSPEVQMEETIVSEISESSNVNVVEATIDANKPCGNIVKTSDEEHRGVGDVDGSASMKQVIDKDDAPEERDFSTVSTDYDEAAVKVELTAEENEEVLTDVNELSTKEEQTIPEAQDPDNENQGSKVVAEEACGSKHPETEVVDAVDGTFEEEKSEPTGITGETDGISREMDVSDSQCTESVSMEETNSHQSRELETQVLAAVPDVIPEIGENENAAMVEKTTEDDKTGVEVQHDEDLDLASAVEVAKSEEQQRTVDGDSEANANMKEVAKVEALIDALIGEEVTATTNATYLSLEKAATTQEPSPRTQTEETIMSEVSQSPNVNVVEATIDADKTCENTVETSNDKEHHGVGDVDGSESVKQVIEKDGVSEERDFGTLSTDYDEVAAKVERTSEENEEALTDTKEFPRTEEQAILEAHGEQKASLEQPRTMVGVTEEESLTDVLVQESESPELSSASEVAKNECVEKDKQMEDVASAANESSETRSLIFEEETVEASKEYENAVGADGVIQDDIPNEKDNIGHGKAHEGESSEKVKPTCEISSESLAVGEEGDSGIIPGEGISEIEASASSVIAADADTDDVQNIVSAAVADEVEEHVEEKVSEIAETPYEESNDAATLTTEETVVKSRETEKDEPAKESDSDILTDNALEMDDTERDGILVEEAHNPHGEAEESTSIKEEVAEKASITEEIHAAYKERDSISAPSVDIAAKDLNEQIQVGNIEPEANATSAGYSPITDVLESDATVDEQVNTSMEEMKEVKEVEKEIPEEAEDRCENIDREEPEISLSEADQDQKPVEKTAETETGHGKEEPEEVLTTVCPSTEELGGTEKASGPANGSIDHAEATAIVEEVTVKNTDVGGSELESGVAEKISMETAEFASVPEEMEEAVKEVELRHDENLQATPAPEAAEEVCLGKAKETSTEATESASITEEVEETPKEVELLHDENPQSAPVPEAVEEIYLEKDKEISTEAAESASVAEEIEQTTKEAELRHAENLQPASAPVPAEEVCSEKAEEVITKTAESISVTEEIEETTKEVYLRHEENLESALAPESAEEACPEKFEEVTNTAESESGSITEDNDVTAKEVELRYDQNVEPAFTPEATDDVCSGKAEEMGIRAAEYVSVTEEIEEVTKEVELRHDNNLQSAPAPEPAKEVCSENAEEMSTTGAESLSGIETHKVSNQLEDAEIIEKHFEVAPANSVPQEPAEKIADEISRGIASAEKPVYPFVEEHESQKPHPAVEETPEEIHQENKLKDEEVIEEKMETLTSTVNELRNQEEKIFKVEDEPAHKEVGDINGEIVQEGKVSTAISEGEGPSERSLCKTMETVIPTGKDDGATIEKPEESILGPETPHLPEHGREEVVCTPGGKALEELALADAAALPLSDLLKKPAIETLQATTRAVETSDAVESSLEEETTKAEEAKTDEERDEHEDEHREHSPEHDTPVMVESSKDIDVKTPQKKSHNILSGVGSKVKHSISKVKKAITGKSSHSKTVSPPKQSS